MSKAFVKEGSKAFVKEGSDGAPVALPDREISPHANLVTAEGLAQIEATLALQKDHANSSEGDASSVARDLRYWTAQRATAQITPDSDASQVKFGSRVTVERDDGRRATYRIVGMRKVFPITRPSEPKRMARPRGTMSRRIKKRANPLTTPHQVRFGHKRNVAELTQECLFCPESRHSKACRQTSALCQIWTFRPTR